MHLTRVGFQPTAENSRRERRIHVYLAMYRSVWSKVEALEDPMNDYKMSNMAVVTERRTNNASNANRRNWWECCKIRSNRISVYEGGFGILTGWLPI